METKYLLAGTGIFLVFAYAIGSGVWVSSSPGWYATLNLPSWQPPDFIFGIIWPYNFVVLGFAAYNVTQSLSRNLAITWIVLFAASVASALTWAYQFYVPHNLFTAATALVITAILTLPVLYITFKASILLGILLVPYQIWVIIASTLAWGYSTRN